MITAAHVIGALLRFLFAARGARWPPCSDSLVAPAAAVGAVLPAAAQPQRAGPAPGPGAAVAHPAPAASRRRVRLAGRVVAAVGPAGRGAPRRAGPGRACGWPGPAVLGPVTGYAVRLGRAQYGRRCLARMEDQQLILAPPRTGKSGALADRLLDHPGPAIVTSTRADLYQLTAGARSQRGPLLRVQPAARRRPAVDVRLGTCWRPARTW